MTSCRFHIKTAISAEWHEETKCLTIGGFDANGSGLECQFFLSSAEHGRALADSINRATGEAPWFDRLYGDAVEAAQ